MNYSVNITDLEEYILSTVKYISNALKNQLFIAKNAGLVTYWNF